MVRKSLRFAGSLALLCTALQAAAAESAGDLTPFGAERAGNADGSIPAWDGYLQQMPANWKIGDPDPLAGEKPLYSIDASNVDKYLDQLPPGQVAMLKTYPGYRLDVYPSHRSCGFPKVVAERTQKYAGQSRIAADGWRLENAAGAIVPFPQPRSGIEAVWNYKTRYMGKGRRYQSSLLLKEANGGLSEFKQWNYELYPHSDPALEPGAEEGKFETKQLYEILTPPSRAGELYLIHSFMGEPQDAWIYFPGQRRVRRAPSFAYDNPIAGSDGLYMVDQIHMYSGAPDRYDFKLLGKREMIIPYNNYKLAESTNKYADLLGKDYLNRQYSRYEKHRVWVVEATVKADKRHSFAKREFFFDEDSWSLQAVAIYDAKGNLWRSQDNSLAASPQLGACLNVGWENYDLVARRYLADDFFQEGEKLDLNAVDDGAIDDKMFTADALRRQGER